MNLVEVRFVAGIGLFLQFVYLLRVTEAIRCDKFKLSKEQKKVAGHLGE